MSTKDGKYLEQLVLLIEQSIDPNARMAHDVQMNLNGRTFWNLLKLSNSSNVLDFGQMLPNVFVYDFLREKDASPFPLFR